MSNLTSINIEYCLKSDKSVIEFFKRRLCKICKEIPLPSFRDKLKYNDYYCERCFQLNCLNKDNDIDTNEQQYLKGLIIKCRHNNCIKTFSYENKNKVLEHEIIHIEEKNNHDDNDEFNNAVTCTKYCEYTFDDVKYHDKTKSIYSSDYNNDHNWNEIVNLIEARFQEKFERKLEEVTNFSIGIKNELQSNFHNDLYAIKIKIDELSQNSKNFDNFEKHLNEKLGLFVEFNKLEDITKSINNRFETLLSKSEFECFKVNMENRLEVDSKINEFEKLKKNIDEKFESTINLEKFENIQKQLEEKFELTMNLTELKKIKDHIEERLEANQKNLVNLRDEINKKLNENEARLIKIEENYVSKDENMKTTQIEEEINSLSQRILESKNSNENEEITKFMNSFNIKIRYGERLISLLNSNEKDQKVFNENSQNLMKVEKTPFIYENLNSIVVSDEIKNEISLSENTKITEMNSKYEQNRSEINSILNQIFILNEEDLTNSIETLDCNLGRLKVKGLDFINKKNTLSKGKLQITNFIVENIKLILNYKNCLILNRSKSLIFYAKDTYKEIDQFTNESNINSFTIANDIIIIADSKGKIKFLGNQNNQIQVLYENGVNSQLNIISYVQGKLIGISSEKIIYIFEFNLNPEDFCLKVRKSMKGHNSQISCFSLKNEILMTGSYDYTIKLWKIDDNSTTSIKSINMHSHWVTSLQILQSNELLASGGRDGFLFFYDTKNNFDCVQKIQLSSTSKNDIYMIEIPEIKTLITCYSTKISFWNLESYSLIREILLSHEIESISRIKSNSVIICLKKQSLIIESLTV